MSTTVKYNRTFEFNPTEIQMIESALRFSINHDGHLSVDEIAEMYTLLGAIHNQKTWYRPTNETYISG